VELFFLSFSLLHVLDFGDRGYLRQGITVWLDVPVEALAARVCAVGCESRPLLGQVSAESAYVQALTALENLFEERESYYKNADASVCVSGTKNPQL
jgi:shikimate kinase